MVKELIFDLEFGERHIKAISENGRQFLKAYGFVTMKDAYDAAMAIGLHAQFTTADARNQLTAISALEPRHQD